MIVNYLLILPPTLVFIMTGSLLRSLTPITVPNIASLAITLWLTSLLRNLSDIVHSFPSGEIAISTLATSGTLLALLFVALNTDVRGKAELNKIAGLACRTALHESTPKLLRLAEALATIRVRASKKLLYFPTASELFELTGREDLCWRGSRLLPLTADLRPAWAEFTSQTVIKLGLLSLYDELVDNHTPRWPHGKRRSVISKNDAAGQCSVLKSESKTMREILLKFYESSMTEKLNRVLNRPARHYFIHFYQEGFNPDVTPTVRIKNKESWHDYIFGKDVSSTLEGKGTNLPMLTQVIATCGKNTKF